MFEYHIYKKSTNEYEILFGHSYEDAWRRTKMDLNRSEWVLIDYEYID